jgi:hypothetical protein
VLRSRWLWLLIVWAVSAGLLFAVFESGRTGYHRYQDADGWGLNKEAYIGENLGDEVRGGERYIYVGIRRVFEKDPGPRVFLAAVIVPVAILITVRLFRPTPSPSPPTPPAGPPGAS